MTARRLFLAVAALAAGLALFPTGRLFAGVTAEVAPGEVGLGESVLLRVVVDGEAPAVVDVSGLGDFLVTPRGKVVGSRQEGNTTATVTAYRFELSPRRAGELVVPPLAVTTDGTTVHTPELRVRVRPKPTPPPDLTGREIALDAQVSTTEPFVGEQFRYTLRLFRSRAMEAVTVAPPEFPGFVVLALPGQRDTEITAAGKHFAVAEVDYLLRPTRPGRIDLAPGAAACREAADPHKTSKAPFLTCAGPALTVTVRPLPPCPEPDSWSGLVGQASLSARLEPAGPDGADRPSLVVTLAGQGNLTEVDPPVLPPLAGITVQPLAPQDTGGLWPQRLPGRQDLSLPAFRPAARGDGPARSGPDLFRSRTRDFCDSPGHAPVPGRPAAWGHRPRSHARAGSAGNGGQQHRAAAVAAGPGPGPGRPGPVPGLSPRTTPWPPADGAGQAKPLGPWPRPCAGPAPKT